MFSRIIILFFLSNIILSVTIIGQVYDNQNGTPLIGASVYLENTSYGTTTDGFGQYLITDVPIGDYKIIAKYLGYENQIQDISIKENIKKRISVKFSLMATKIELKGTEIIGTIQKKDKITEAPATKEVISEEQIQIESSANLGSYLKGLKGVDYTASGVDSYSISVRGFNSSFSSRLLTLTDGRVANVPALRVVSYNTIPQSQDDIQKMEVILGPSTALYGANAHSGVVNIISKPPSTSEGFSMHVSGSNDARELRKINGRYAKKLNDYISFKRTIIFYTFLQKES